MAPRRRAARPLPLVSLRDPDEKLRPIILFCTDQEIAPVQVIARYTILCCYRTKQSIGWPRQS